MPLLTYDNHRQTTSDAKSRSAHWRTGTITYAFALIFLVLGLTSSQTMAQSFSEGNKTTSVGSSININSDPLFTVVNVLVRGSGAGSAEARKRAFELAHIAGLRRIVGRLTSVSERENLRLPELEKLTAMVELIEVKDQRLSDTTLVALMDLKFSEAKIKAYLAAEGISFSITRSKPFIVLPILQAQGQQFGWDERNPWFRAWQGKVLPSGLVAFELPKTKADFDLLLELVKSGAQKQLQEQIHTMGGGALLLADSSVSLNTQGGLDAIMVDVLRFAGKSSGQIGKSSLRYDSKVEVGEDIPSIFAKAATAIASDYNRSWKEQSSTQANERSELEFEAPIEGLNSWLELEQALNDIGLIELVDLQSLSDTSVIARLEFSGTLDQLSAVLGQQGIDLIPSVDRFFLVK